MTVGVEGQGGAEVFAPGPLVPIEYASQLAVIEQLTWMDVDDHFIIQDVEANTPVDLWMHVNGSSELDGKFGFVLSLETEELSGKKLRRYLKEFANSYSAIEFGDNDKHQSQHIISTEVGNYLLWADPRIGSIRLETLGSLADESLQLTDLRHGIDNSTRSFADFTDVAGRLIGGCYARSSVTELSRKLELEFELPEDELEDVAETEEKASPSKELVAVEKKKEQQSDVRVPELRFDDVGGLTRAKAALNKVVEAYYNPEVYEKFGLRSPRMILLRGEAGSGKQMLAEAFAGEIGAIYDVHPPANIYKKFVGESEKSIQEIFSSAKDQATDEQAVVLVFPHMDTILESRGASDGGTSARVAEQLESEIKQLVRGDKDVFVVATTKRIGHFITRQTPAAFDLEHIDPTELADALAGRDVGEILRMLNGLIGYLADQEIMTGKPQKPYDTATAIEAIKKSRTT